MTRATDVAVLIATYNRAGRLGETLDVLAATQPGNYRWEVVVIDNNSTDDTREVVAARQRGYPVPLRWLSERTQGRSAALNTGIAATTAPLLLFTDDDVRVSPAWLQRGAQALEQGADYVGGPVRPIWEAPPPRWLDLTRSDLWGTIAILDYGPEAFDFQERRRVPLGANMGVRRSMVRRTGTFHVNLGRSAGRRVLGQEVPELLTRARAAGCTGRYVPAMVVEHHVPAARLTRQYFRRWWFGKGYSKAILDAAQPITELGLDLRAVPHLGGVPRFMLVDGIRDAIAYLWAAVSGGHEERMRRAMRIAYLFGYLQARGWHRPEYSSPVGFATGVESTSSPMAAGL